MSPRTNRHKKKKKTVQYLVMPPGFTPGTRDATFAPLTEDERHGKAVVEDDSSDEEPDELESFAHCSKKGGPSLNRINSLKKPNLPPMSTWTLEDYEKYDAYLIKKWQISGWGKKDGVYVGSRDFHSDVANAARKFYNFKRVIHGRTISQLAQHGPLPVPDVSLMHVWTTRDYDLYDLSLINKWQNIGWDESDSTYASIRDKSTLVFKTAENIKKREGKRDLPTPVSRTSQAKRKRSDLK